MGLLRVVTVTASLIWATAASAAEPVLLPPTAVPPAAVSPTAVPPAAPRPILPLRDAIAQSNVDRRADVLARYIGPNIALAAMEPYWGLASATLCGAGAAFTAVDDRENDDSRPYAIGVLGACSVLSLVSYALPRDYRNDVVALAFFGGLGGTLIAGVNTSEHSTASRVTLSALGASSIAYGGLRLLDAGLRRPVAGSTLRAHAMQLAARRGSLSAAELARMERDFHRAHERPIPRWAFGVSQVLAGVVAMSPAWFDSTSGRDRLSAYAFGALLVAQGSLNFTVALTAPSPYDRYVEALRELKLDFELAPTGPGRSLGLSLSGRF